MRRTNFDEDLPPPGVPPGMERTLRCAVCLQSAAIATLSSYGARCGACYAAYCAEANPSWWSNRALTHDERASIIRKAKRGLAAIGQQPAAAT